MTPLVAPARAMVDRLVALGPESAHVALDMLLNKLSVTELAALGYDWVETWARPNQILPDDDWRTNGFLTARRFGKSWSNGAYVCQEAEAGRSMRIGFAAQNLDKTLEVMVHGDCGLLAMSPPWFKARWENGRVVWPNGAQAFPFTPEVPGSFRGPGLHLFWASEIQSWPTAGMDEAFSNALLMTSLGYARMIWDATPKRRHPILRMLLARAAEDPARHRVVRGRIEENRDNLGKGAPEEMRARLTGQRAKEELDGEYLDDDEGALWKQAWIDAHRRALPSALARQIISIDPALSALAGTDETGIMRLGLGADGQGYVVDDKTKHYAWEAWGEIAVADYLEHECDCIVVERNAGFDALAANIRSAAREWGAKRGVTISVQVVEKDARTRHSATAIYIKEVFSRKSKDQRAEPCAVAYERGRVSHVIGAELGALEDVLTTWTPGPGSKSPNALDALVQGLWELGVVSAEDEGVSAKGLGERVRQMQRGAATESDAFAGKPQSHPAAREGDPRWAGRARGGSSLNTRRVL